MSSASSAHVLSCYLYSPHRTHEQADSVPVLYQCMCWDILHDTKLASRHNSATGGPRWRNYDGIHFCAHGRWSQATGKHAPICALMAVPSALDRATSRPHTMFSNTTMTFRR